MSGWLSWFRAKRRAPSQFPALEGFSRRRVLPQSARISPGSSSPPIEPPRSREHSSHGELKRNSCIFQLWRPSRRPNTAGTSSSISVARSPRLDTPPTPGRMRPRAHRPRGMRASTHRIPGEEHLNNSGDILFHPASAIAGLLMVLLRTLEFSGPQLCSDGRRERVWRRISGKPAY